MGVSNAVQGFARRLVSLTGRQMGMARTRPSEIEDDDSKEARRHKAREAARLAVRVKRLPGRGWFPGDPL